MRILCGFADTQSALVQEELVSIREGMASCAKSRFWPIVTLRCWRTAVTRAPLDLREGSLVSLALPQYSAGTVPSRSSREDSVCISRKEIAFVSRVPGAADSVLKIRLAKLKS